MNRIGSQAGFTLLELIIVLVIFSVILTLSLPLFDPTGKTARPRRELNTLSHLLASLKQEAVQKEKDFCLHISASGTRLWLTDSSMSESEKDHAMEMAFEDFNAIRISRVKTLKPQDGSPETICFFRRGYSDLAILQVEGLDTAVVLKLEPFLPGTQALSDFPDINDCI